MANHSYCPDFETNQTPPKPTKFIWRTRGPPASAEKVPRCQYVVLLHSQDDKNDGIKSRLRGQGRPRGRNQSTARCARHYPNPVPFNRKIKKRSKKDQRNVFFLIFGTSGPLGAFGPVV